MKVGDWVLVKVPAAVVNGKVRKAHSFRAEVIGRGAPGLVRVQGIDGFCHEVDPHWCFKAAALPVVPPPSSPARVYRPDSEQPTVVGIAYRAR